MIKAMPNVLSVMAVNLLFMSVFAILGVQLFSGRFATCISAPELTARDACLAAGETWENPRLGHLDSFPAAMLILFECATFEGWPDVMFAMIDATDQGHAPELNHSPAQGLFMITWIVIGGMFLINVFVGVVFDSFAEMKMTEGGAAALSDDQSEWVKSMEAAYKVQPTRYPPCPPNPLRAWCYGVIRTKWFEPFVLGVILLNAAMLACDGYGISEGFKQLLAAGNELCLVVFVIEAVLKILALSFEEYIQKAWNIFDFTVVVLSLLQELASLIGGSTGLNPSIARALRTVRVARQQRANKSARRLRQMLSTLVFSLPALANISAIFLIVLFLFSVLGMQLFGSVKHGEFLNDDANFCYFGSAAMTMFRSATGESWNGIMHDAMVTPEQGCSEEKGDCGSWLAIPFFVAYTVVANFVVLNMMIAIILDEFAQSQDRENYKLKPEHTEAFVDAWAEFDPYAAGLMNIRFLRSFMRALPPPLGLDPEEFPLHKVRSTNVTAFINELENVHAYDNKVTGTPEVRFLELLESLSKRVYKLHGIELDLEDLANRDGDKKNQMLEGLKEQMARAKQHESSDLPKNDLVQLHSVCVIQQRWNLERALPVVCTSHRVSSPRTAAVTS